MNIDGFFTNMTTPMNQSLNFGTRQAQNDDYNNDAFVNLVTKKLSQNKDEPKESEKLHFATPHKSLKSDNPIFDNKGLDIASIISTNENIEQQVNEIADNLGLDTTEKLALALALNQQATTEAISETSVGDITTGKLEQLTEVAKLLQSLMIEAKAENSGDASPKTLVENVLSKLKDLAEQEDPLLSAVNITPEQITSLQKKVEIALDTEEQDLSDEETNILTAGIMAGLIQISRNQSKESAETTQITNGSENLAASINPATTIKSKENDGYSFKDMMEEISSHLNTAQTKNSSTQTPAQGTNAKTPANSITNAQTQTPDAHTNTAFPDWITTDNSLLDGADSDIALLKEQGLLPLTSSQQNSAATITSLLTQARGAGQAHPATQTVAASLQKMASKESGEQSMKLLLDPPELGRVEVRMTISKDKTMKATILSEKPETHIMLQRDAQALERALQESGINADGSISFELAPDGQDFSQNGRHDGNQGNGYGNADDGSDDNLEIIESTMTWHVDPESGHMRYDILA